MGRQKKRYNLIFAMITLSILLSGISQIAWCKASGGQPGAFLSWGAGARSLGMGKAFVSVADDASATYWNPAGLAQIDRKEIAALHAILWADTIYDFISYVHPITGIGTVGGSITRLHSGKFDGRDINNEPTHEFSDSQTALGASYGKQIVDVLALGASIKYVTHNLDDHKNGNFTVDMGAMYKSPMVEHLQAGFNLRNLIGLKTGAETEDKLPLTLRFGFNYKLLRDRLALVVDLEKSKAPLSYHFGGEYWAFQYLAVRLGMDPEEFTVGFGIRYRDYGLDYAFATHELGGSHRLSASWRFGPSITAASETMALEHYKEAVAAYERGLYQRAVEKLTSSLSLDPKNIEAKNKLVKLERVAKIIPKEVKETKRAKLIKQAVLSYLDGDIKLTINALRYLSSMEPEDREVDRLLKTIARVEGVELLEEVTPGMSLVDQKLYNALNYFYEGKYDMTIREAQDVLTLEPNNALAYKRIGSAFFAMGQREKAREAWEKSLQMNPADRSLKEFLDTWQEKGYPEDRELEYLQELEKKKWELPKEKK
ncbi:MAG: PorV/PorQ family protein [Elusimicrobiota bacterium]|nr:PorV/PorQ family protein [Elusimicrobiota bacterium]MDH5662114.1 PorV/PorQ family protein [Elusimicrobiota bacterium]